MDDPVGRIRADWPAALAVLVLVLGHLGLTVFVEDQTPLGIPLIAAVVVFLLGELVRQFA